MRAVKAVLTAAAALKRKQPLEREDILILRAIIDVNLPKFLLQDAMLFQGIVGDLMPGVRLPPSDQKNLHDCISSVMLTMRLQPLPAFKKKVL
jgi:dynein heavy chain